VNRCVPTTILAVCCVDATPAAHAVAGGGGRTLRACRSRVCRTRPDANTSVVILVIDLNLSTDQGDKELGAIPPAIEPEAGWQKRASCTDKAE
jgi:hypothetical protein